jgi:HPt (histidine-containing phosphotransfer) domain-containing protein
MAEYNKADYDLQAEKSELLEKLTGYFEQDMQESKKAIDAAIASGDTFSGTLIDRAQQIFERRQYWGE